MEKQSGKRCLLTGKKTSRGRKYAVRGIAKKKKGIGLNITGKTKRSFHPNILKKRFWFAPEKRFISLKLSAAAMRTIDKVGLEAVVQKLRKKGQKI